MLIFFQWRCWWWYNYHESIYMNKELFQKPKSNDFRTFFVDKRTFDFLLHALSNMKWKRIFHIFVKPGRYLQKHSSTTFYASEIFLNAKLLWIYTWELVRRTTAKKIDLKVPLMIDIDVKNYWFYMLASLRTIFKIFWRYKCIDIIVKF